MDEDDIEVTERARLGPSVATHRHEGHPSAFTAGGLVEQTGQPLVSCVSVGTAEGITP